MKNWAVIIAVGVVFTFGFWAGLVVPSPRVPPVQPVIEKAVQPSQNPTPTIWTESPGWTIMYEGEPHMIDVGFNLDMNPKIIGGKMIWRMGRVLTRTTQPPPVVSAEGNPTNAPPAKTGWWRGGR